jgi:hypothetical protein
LANAARPRRVPGRAGAAADEIVVKPAVEAGTNPLIESFAGDLCAIVPVKVAERLNDDVARREEQVAGLIGWSSSSVPKHQQRLVFGAAGSISQEFADIRVGGMSTQTDVWPVFTIANLDAGDPASTHRHCYFHR